MNRDARLTLAGGLASGLLIAGVAAIQSSVWIQTTLAGTGAGVTAAGMAVALAIEHFSQ